MGNQNPVGHHIKQYPPLNLRAGEWVEVRSQIDILSTLDRRGCFDNLPFMPEMLQFCGKRFSVCKRADKTCDTITGEYKSRRMYDTVHLADLRCNGDAHGGCDATCLLFWKEAWLKRVDENDSAGIQIDKGTMDPTIFTVDDLNKATRIGTAINGEGEERFSCQATELLRASAPLAWWNVGQYLRELKSGNVGVIEVARLLSIGFLNWLFSKRGFGRLYYWISGYRRYPHMDTRLMVKGVTPFETLNLQPGEIVQVKNIEEIMTTLNKWRNRGLIYDMHGEMIKYCGKKMKVMKRVKKLIDEKSGRLITLKNESVILEGAICCGHYSPNRLLCPRSICSFWREIWLERVDSDK